MGNLFFVLVILTVLGVLAAILKNRTSGPSGEVTYEVRQELFSPAERSFFRVLEQAVEGRYRIFGKVRMGDLIQPAKGLSRSQRTGAWNRIHQKHVDFVLCLPDTLAVAAVVELDDASHRRKDRAGRDEFVDNVLGGAGIPIVHFAARRGYAVQEVWAKLDEVLSLGSDNTAELEAAGKISEGPCTHDASGEPGGPAEKVHKADTLESENMMGSIGSVEENGQVALVCSACNSPMVKRLAKKGLNAGKWFWACSAFPKCRKVVEIRI